ncbi:hypothetical protein DFH07DRAFT_816053 [Mycena maculata]|uniref:Uncharacterized protein n=1 Tax=Mycena maculata TaxID=230809 RepID=A0AAD7JD85_9AGAR|nr:hypothetical protein DFH07DRAFT_816053 [Mycena maculata]
MRANATPMFRPATQLLLIRAFLVTGVHALLALDLTRLSFSAWGLVRLDDNHDMWRTSTIPTLCPHPRAHAAIDRAPLTLPCPAPVTCPRRYARREPLAGRRERTAACTKIRRIQARAHAPRCIPILMHVIPVLPHPARRCLCERGAHWHALRFSTARPLAPLAASPVPRMDGRTST